MPMGQVSTQPTARRSGCRCGASAGCPGSCRGCCGREEAGCAFTCLSRPQFYCGMVLTDDHLNELERYMRQRLALHRHVEGWGVAAGLALRPDPDHPGSVVVGPGYARSCCGDDIVVCENLTLDVCSCGSGGPCCVAGQPAAAKDKRTATSGAVDVYLVTEQTPTDPIAVGGCSCGSHDELVHERVIDGGALWCVPVDDGGTDPATRAYEEWATGFASCADVLDEFNGRMSGATDKEAVRDWLLRWIDRQSEPALELIRSWLADPDRVADIPGDGATLSIHALVEIVTTLRIAYLDRTSVSCPDTSGANAVLLGRVWTKREAGGCRVLCIDDQPPYRRVLAPTGWPHRPGEVNVASLLWQRRAVAQERGSASWVSLQATQLDTAEFQAVASKLKNSPTSVPRQSRLTGFLFPDHCFKSTAREDTGRVVAWELAQEGVNS